MRRDQFQTSINVIILGTPLPTQRLMGKRKKPVSLLSYSQWGHTGQQQPLSKRVRSSPPSLPHHEAKAGGTAQSQDVSATSRPAPKQQLPKKRWLRCQSDVDQQASDAVHTLLQASRSKSRGASIRSLTLAPHITAKKAVHAVTCETLKCEFAAMQDGWQPPCQLHCKSSASTLSCHCTDLPLLRDLLGDTDVLQQTPDLRPATGYVLAFEMLFGQVNICLLLRLHVRRLLDASPLMRLKQPLLFRAAEGKAEQRRQLHE